jgi:hypothetical protein
MDVSSAPWGGAFPPTFPRAILRRRGRKKLGWIEVERTGIEPVTSGLQSRRSPS